MRSKHITVLVGLIVTAILLISGSGMVVAQDNGGNVGAQACVAPCLYDQLAGPIVTGAISQNFEDAYNSLDNRAADDFPIPPGAFFWSINKIEVDGIYYSTGGSYQAGSVNVSFSNNAGSLPGTTVYQLGPIVPSAGLPSGSFVINLNPPAGLLADKTSVKTYWVSVQANLGTGFPTPNGNAQQWWWSVRGTSSNNTAAWINPLNGSGFDCQVWTPLATCITVPPPSTPDMLFKLSGFQINIAATVYLPLISR